MEQLNILIQPLIVKYVLYCMIGTIIAFTVPLFIILIIHKIRVERHDSNITALEQAYAAMVMRKLDNTDLEIPIPVSADEFEALGSALADAGINNDSHASAKLRMIARSAGVDTYYQEMVKSASWTKRYAAIEKLGFLKFPEFEEFFIGILEKEKNPHVQVKTIWALSMVATVDNLQVINSFLNDPMFTSAKFKEYIYTNIISAFRNRGETQLFMEWFNVAINQENLPLLLCKDIIEACGSERLAEAEALICCCHEKFNDSPDIRISCIRALENIGGDFCSAIIRNSLSDDDWRIRAVAAKNADAWGDEYLDQLKHLLHDPSYQVRINSAQALLRCGEAGIAILRNGTASSDRFVRDIASYILSEAKHV